MFPFPESGSTLCNPVMQPSRGHSVYPSVLKAFAAFAGTEIAASPSSDSMLLAMTCKSDWIPGHRLGSARNDGMMVLPRHLDISTLRYRSSPLSPRLRVTASRGFPLLLAPGYWILGTVFTTLP